MHNQMQADAESVVLLPPAKGQPAALLWALLWASDTLLDCTNPLDMLSQWLLLQMMMWLCAQEVMTEVLQGCTKVQSSIELDL